MYKFKIPLLKRIIPSLRRRIRLLTNRRFFWTKINNIYFFIDIQDKIDREFYYKKKFEENNFDYIYGQKFFEKDFIFLDVGCNSGIYTLNILNHYNTCKKVLAFEPIQETFKKYKKNVNKNNIENKVEAFNIALSNKNEIKKMKSIYRNNKLQSAVYEIQDDGDIEVNSRSFDSLFKYKDENIFLKCDTEGHELEVLSGMETALQNNNFFIQIEILEKNYNSVSIFLNNLGYKKIFDSSEKNSFFYEKK